MPRRLYSPSQPGQAIYAYCHTRTRQVLYSLERTLHKDHLAQLPDAGANNTPPSLRRDTWRPLFSVHLPDTDHGAAQGLEVFEQLREFRRLHETMWEPPKRLAIPYTEEQIEKLKTHLEQRGGAKKESAYDLIARKKKKIKQHMVMDQKANSIADLAAVLLLQEEKMETQAKAMGRYRRAEVLEMQRLARIGEEVKKSLMKEIDELKQAAEARGDDRRKRKLLSKVDACYLQLRKIEFAKVAVEKARQHAAEDLRAKAAAAAETAAAETAAAETAAAAATEKTLEGMTTTPTEITSFSPPPEISVDYKKMDLKPYLPSWPPRLLRDPISAAKRPEPSQKETDLVRILTDSGTPLKTAKWEAARISESTVNTGGPAMWSMQGIKVRWSNTLDAEFAAQWPEHVVHEPMGIVRNTAPKPDAEPILDVGEFKALQWKNRVENFQLQDGLARKVARRREELGLVPHPVLTNKLDDPNRDLRFKARKKMPVGRVGPERMEVLERVQRKVMGGLGGIGGATLKRLGFMHNMRVPERRVEA